LVIITTPLHLIPLLSEPHRNRRPGRAEALEVAKTHRGVLSFARSKEILKNIGLELDANSYYNLRSKELSKSMNAHEEALFILCELEGRSDIHVSILKKYVEDGEGRKTA